MTRSDRYLLRELAPPFLVGLVLAVLLIVALQLQQDVAALTRGREEATLALQRVFLGLPRVLTMALPVATALSVSLAVNRLARDNEITVLRGAGLRLARLFAPLALFGLLLSTANLFIADRLVPAAWRRASALPQSGLEELQTGALPDAQTRTLVYFGAARRLDERRQALEQVLVLRRGQLLTAPSAVYADHLLTLQSAAVHEYDAKGFLIRETLVPSRGVPVSLDFAQNVSLINNDLANLSFAELTRLRDAALSRGDRGRFVELETSRWFKVALPTLCLAFALCAPPLALRFSKAGGFSGVLLSVVAVFIGWNTHLFLQAISLGGWVPPVVCAFTTHALFILVGLLALRSLE